MSKLSSKFKLTVQGEATSEPSPSKKPVPKAKAAKKQAKGE